MPRPYVFKPGVRYTIKQDDENTIGYEILDILKQDNMLVTAFHPELTGDLRFHRYFLEMVASSKL